MYFDAWRDDIWILIDHFALSLRIHFKLVDRNDKKRKLYSPVNIVPTYSFETQQGQCKGNHKFIGEKKNQFKTIISFIFFPPVILPMIKVDF